MSSGFGEGKEVVRRGGVPPSPSSSPKKKKKRPPLGEGGEANPTSQLHETPLHGTFLRWTAQNFALFPHSLPFSIFFLSGGLLVELSPRFKAVDHIMCTFGTPEKPKRALWVGHGLKPRPFHEKSPSEREARTKFATERRKKRDFGGPLGPPPSHPPTLQAPLFQGLGPRPSFFIFLIFHFLCIFLSFLFIVVACGLEVLPALCAPVPATVSDKFPLLRCSDVMVWVNSGRLFALVVWVFYTICQLDE